MFRSTVGNVARVGGLQVRSSAGTGNRAAHSQCVALAHISTPKAIDVPISSSLPSPFLNWVDRSCRKPPSRRCVGCAMVCLGRQQRAQAPPQLGVLGCMHGHPASRDNGCARSSFPTRPRHFKSGTNTELRGGLVTPPEGHHYKVERRGGWCAIKCCFVISTTNAPAAPFLGSTDQARHAADPRRPEE